VTQKLQDPLDPARAAALAVTLGLSQADNDDHLIPFGHQIYFWDPQRSADLGPDSHPKTGLGLIPDLGLPQRMWACGSLVFHEPLRLGEPALKETTLSEVQVKQGRTGQLGFVTLTHRMSQAGTLKVTEQQDLVYRQAPNDQSPTTPPRARCDEDKCVPIQFDTTTLFRYSALTFNGHRIHYDADYARDVEGYAGLVVHGPLLAQHLILLATRQLGKLNRFAFRATSPLIVGEAADLCWSNDGSLWVRGPDGRQCMTGMAS